MYAALEVLITFGTNITIKGGMSNSKVQKDEGFGIYSIFLNK